MLKYIVQIGGLNSLQFVTHMEYDNILLRTSTLTYIYHALLYIQDHTLYITPQDIMTHIYKKYMHNNQQTTIVLWWQ